MADDTISHIAKAVTAERERCANLALLIETEGHPELYGDPDLPTPITDALREHGSSAVAERERRVMHLPDELTERLEAGDDAAVSEALLLLASLLGGDHDYYYVLFTAADIIGRDRRERRDGQVMGDSEADATRYGALDEGCLSSIVTPGHLRSDIVEIIAMAMMREDGCCGCRDEDGRCCMSDIARDVLAALEDAGLRQAAMQSIILAKSSKGGPAA